jgi:hypothetical protein
MQLPEPQIVPPAPPGQLEGRERLLKQRVVVEQLKAEVVAVEEKVETLRKLGQLDEAKRLAEALAVARVRLEKETAVLDELTRRLLQPQPVLPRDK